MKGARQAQINIPALLFLDFHLGQVTPLSLRFSDSEMGDNNGYFLWLYLEHSRYTVNGSSLISFYQ